MMLNFELLTWTSYPSPQHWARLVPVYGMGSSTVPIGS